MAAVQIAAALGAIKPASGRMVVRTSGGTLYALILVTTTLRLYKSTDGTTWTEPDSAHRPTIVSGTSASIAINASDVISVIYVVGGTNIITYNTYSTSTDLFGTAENVNVGGSNNGLTSIDIAIDSNGVPHIVVGTTTIASNTVYYKNRVGGVWNANVTTITVTNGCTSCQILIDQNNIPQYVAQHDTISINVLIGNTNNATSFTTKTFTTFPNGVSICLDSQNSTWIAYGTGGTSNVKPIVLLRKHTDGDAWATWSTIVIKAGNLPVLAISGQTLFLLYKDALNNIVSAIFSGSKQIGSAVIETATVNNPKLKWSYLNDNQQGTQMDYIFDNATTIFWNTLSVIPYPVTGYVTKVNLKPAPFKPGIAR